MMVAGNGPKMKTCILIRLFIIFPCVVITFVSCTSQDVDLPRYEVLDVAHMIDGGKTVEILVPSYSRDTPIEELKRFTEEIARIDGYIRISLYCTEEAYRAEHSHTYYREHPKAKEEGYLGFYEYGRFRLPHS